MTQGKGWGECMALANSEGRYGAPLANQQPMDLPLLILLQSISGQLG